jgi:uncharacterized membrane protein
LNLLFIGGIATAVWHHREQYRRLPGLLDFVERLPPGRQDAVRTEVTAARAALDGLREKLRSSWLATNALLTAEPFDKEKFKAALAQLREIEDQYKTSINDAMAETAATLSPDERKMLQEWRVKRHPWLRRQANKNKSDE